MKSISIRIYILFLIIVLLLVSGCQKTPERSPVVYGRDLMNKILEPAADYGTYDAPEEWQETVKMKGSGTIVEIDASVIVPDVIAFPVYEVEYNPFDITQVEFLINYFANGKDVYEHAELTKAELEEQLLYAKKNNDEEMIAEYEKRIADAPQEVISKIITDWNPECSLSGYFTEDDGMKSTIAVLPEYFSYMKGFVMANHIFELNGISVEEDIGISEKDAVAAANDLLIELGIECMVDVELEHAQYFASIDNAFSDTEYEVLSTGYIVKFAREVDGIAGIIGHVTLYHGSETIHYKAPLYPEEIQIFVDETGEVKSFAWKYPLETGDCINKNISLLAFDDVQQRIRDMLIYVNSYDSVPAVVTDVELNMTIVSMQDDINRAMYVPAWFVYYTIEFDDVMEDDSIIRREQEFVIALNATDGGRIADLPLDINPEMWSKE